MLQHAELELLGLFVCFTEVRKVLVDVDGNDIEDLGAGRLLFVSILQVGPSLLLADLLGSIL